MNCNKVLSRLHAYVDGEVPAKLMRKMEEHLSACPSCRGQVESIRQVDYILDNLAVPPLPQGFSASVMAEARRRTLPKSEERPLLGLDWMPLRWFAELTVPMRLATFAMVLLACLLGMFMSRDLSLSGSPRTTVVEAENLDGFEWFSPTPPTSLGSAYLTLALTAPDEKSVNR
jgi:anti-sigma factor RsiW